MLRKENILFRFSSATHEGSTYAISVFLRMRKNTEFNITLLLSNTSTGLQIPAWYMEPTSLPNDTYLETVLLKYLRFSSFETPIPFRSQCDNKLHEPRT